MLRRALRSTLIAAALLAGGSQTGLVGHLLAADCPCKSSPAPSVMKGPATLPPGHAHGVAASPAPAGHGAGGYGPGGYGPGGYGPGGYGPGGYGPNGYRQGPIHAAIASHYAPNCRPNIYGSPDLFANYYTPSGCGGATAGLYPAPYTWTPRSVGHTYYTYQPMAPHEQLYKHHRTYHRYYNGGRGLTRARVKWYYPPVRAGAESILSHFRLAR